MDEHQASLMQCYPLPAAWSAPAVFEEIVTLGCVELYLTGLSSCGPQGFQATGSAATVGEWSFERAYFELLERVAIREAAIDAKASYTVFDERRRVVGVAERMEVFPESTSPQHWRYALSNGVAAHTSWELACENARLELLERDRLMRSWFGLVDPLPIRAAADWFPEGLRSFYEFRAHEFSSGSEASVVAVFGWPRTLVAPLVYGFGAAVDLRRAAKKAADECIQRLGFLWGEAVATEPPESSPTPDFHQEYFLQQDARSIIEEWLAGGHRSINVDLAQPARPRTSGYVDLTPAQLKGRLYVAKALDGRTLPLTFGAEYPLLRAPIPPQLRIHPFC